MIVTARQLEEMHRDGGRNGRVTLKPGTRLSPLAREWIRKTQVAIEYEIASISSETIKSPRPRRGIFWSDGEHAIAKAAVMSLGNSVNLEQLNSAPDVVTAVRKVVDHLLAHRADAGILLLKSAGAATVHANRIPEIRAIVATTVESVDEAMKSISPNVLLVESSNQSFTEIRNILGRFLRTGGAA